MPHSSFRSFFLGLVPFVVGLLLTEQLLAQGVRPGGASRGTTSGTRTTTTRTGTGTTGTRSANGQRQYRSNTELGDAMIQIDPETRSLVIVTDEDTHTELSKVIESLDKPKPQVLIKVVFVEITYNKGLDVGVEGSYTFNLKNSAPASTGSQVTTTNESRTTDTGGTRTSVTTLTKTLGDAAKVGETATIEALNGLAGLSTGYFVRLASDDWSATLRLLATKGKLEVLSRPSIMARNNQEAVIVVGSEVPFITNSRITDDGQTINTIQYDNVGIILRVTPFITSEGTVEMIVAPEISTLTDQTVPISNNASAPVIAKRSAETVVVTPHAETVVIGGLMETQKTESVQKVPILGDIPFLGLPFRRTIKVDQKRELLIFLTPYIINDRQGIVTTTSGEISNAEMLEKAFPQKELSKFLDGLPMPSDGEAPKRPAATPAPKRAKPAPTPAKTKSAGVIKTSAPKTSSR
jgi:general secretion pathway protein D